MGKKRAKLKPIKKWKPGTVRYALAMRVRELTRNIEPNDLAAKLGISGDAARKLMRGDIAMDADHYPAFIKAVGLKSIAELFEGLDRDLT